MDAFLYKKDIDKNNIKDSLDTEWRKIAKTETSKTEKTKKGNADKSEVKPKVKKGDSVEKGHVLIEF